MAVSERTKIQIWGESAARCAYCREQLIYSDKLGIDESLVGEICHIFAQGKNGPRANPLLPSTELDDAKNLILLCRKHHKYVDDHPARFPVEKLKEMKLSHINWVAKNLENCAPWDFNLSTLHYINVPRLAILSAMTGKLETFDIDTSKGLHCLGQHLVSVMVAYQKLLENMHPSVLRGLDFSSPSDDWIGAIFGFDDQFRTKNGPVLDERKNYSDFLTGSLEKDPHVYKKHKEWKLVMVIDPRWLTSSTAFCDFSPPGGRGRFAGLAMIKNIFRDQKLIMASPLVIGLPKSPWQDLLFGR